MSRAHQRTGPLYLDATQVTLTALERDVLYAVAEHQLLASGVATLAGDAAALEAARRLERIGFIVASECSLEGGELRLRATLTPAGEGFLVRRPLGSVPDDAG
jgi:hypothetical protein